MSEEASVHLAYAEASGFLRSLLLIPTSELPAGYLNLVANLAASLAAHVFSLELAATVSTALAFGVQLVPFAIVLWGRSHFWNVPERRIACCMVMLFAPAAHPTVWLSTVNAQVWCGLISFLILCEDLHKASLRKIWTYRFLLLFCALSGTYATMLVIPFLLKIRLEKSRESVRHLAIIAAAALTQVAVYSATAYHLDIAPNRLISARWAASAIGILLFHLLLPIFGRHLIEPLGRTISRPIMAQGDGISPDWIGFVGAVSLLVLIVFGVWLCRRRQDPCYQLFPWSFVFLSVVTSIFAYGLPRDRYAVLPGLVFLLALLVGSWQPATGDGRRRTCRVLLGIAMTVGVATYWVDPSYTLQGQPVSNFGYGAGRPDWREEVAKWRHDPGYVLRVWPYSATQSWRAPMPQRDAFRELRTALATVDNFHLITQQGSAERRVPVDGLPTDFRIIIQGTSDEPAELVSLEVALQTADLTTIAAVPIRKFRAREPFTAHCTSQDLAIIEGNRPLGGSEGGKRNFADTRFLTIRITTDVPRPIVVEIDRIEVVPRIEGLLDALLPVRTFPRRFYHSANAAPRAHEATTLLAVESLLRDGDLRYAARDAARAAGRWRRGPLRLQLKTDDRGPPLYVAPLPYVLTVAPLAALASVAGQTALNAVLFAVILALAVADRRDEGARGKIFAVAALLGAAGAGYVFLPESRVFEMFLLFTAVRLWIRGRLDDGAAWPAAAGVLLAAAAVQEPAWAVLIAVVAGDLAWARRLRPAAAFTATAALTVLTLSLVGAAIRPSFSTTEASPAAAVAVEESLDEESPDELNLATAAWRFFTGHKGLIAGYPFVLLALFLFVRNGGDRQHALLAVALAVLTQWIVWQGYAAARQSPLGSPHFAVLYPLFVLLPRRAAPLPTAALLVPAVAFLLVTFGIMSSVWAP